MRDWRKVYSSLMRSDKVADVSFEARWLYLGLLLEQDDAGRYEWTRARVRSLIAATTEWTTEQACEYLAELEEAGMVEKDAETVRVVRGEELNGNPDPRRNPKLYEIGAAQRGALQRDAAQRGVTRAKEEIREEEIREESPLRGSEAQAHAPAHTPEEIPAWLKTLEAIEPGKLPNGMNRSGVQASDVELIAWAEGKKIGPEVLEEVAQYVASAWHGQLRSRGRESVRATFQQLVNREMRRNVQPFNRASTGRVTPPRDDELTVAWNQ